MNTALFSSLPIVAALLEANTFIGDVLWEERRLRQSTPLKWNPLRGNTLQQDLVRRAFWGPSQRALTRLAPDELSAFAHWDPDVINKSLRDAGFEIQLDPWNPSDRMTFGIVGIIKLLRKWLVPGETGYFVNKWNSAFRLDAERGRIEFYLYDANQVVIRITTQVPGDYVYVTRAPYAKSHFGLLESCRHVQRGMLPYHRPTGVILPNWSFTQEVDVSRLVGLNTTDQGGKVWRLVQALMEGGSTFCAEGTSFKAAFAAAVSKEIAFSAKEPKPDDHIVDYDLMMWIGRDGVDIPLGAVYVMKREFSYTDESLTT